ncbi:hypothetical protein Vretifemale_1461 [Volvox reticuliferus]|nr:hypothetical protein Vretifemale_1461 [Volvox reticuliferus]
MKEVAYPLDDATELGYADSNSQLRAENREASNASTPAQRNPQQVGEAAAAGRSSGGGSNSAFAAAAVESNGLGQASPLPMSRAIVQMSYCEHSKQVVMVLADGACAVCSTSDSGLSPLPEMCFARWLCEPQRQAVCAQVCARAQLIAVGRENGDVELFRLHRTGISSTARSEAGGPGSAGTSPDAHWEPPVRTLSLDNWGHKPQQTGPVAQVEWSPDGRALAVGYAGQGVVVWSPSGCRLMCSLRQPPPSLSTYPSAASRGLISHQNSLASQGPGWGYQRAASSSVGTQPQVPLDGAVSALCWGPMGYQLEMAEVGGGAAMAGAGGGLTEVTFAHSLSGNHRVARGGIGTSLADEEVHVLLAHDRLLLIREAGEAAMGVMPWAAGDVAEPTVSQMGDLTVSHLPVPHSYVSANWPLQRSAISASGTDIAVAGRNGLAVYNRPSERWRLFGDISQERQVSCRALGWLSSGVLVACSGPDPYASPQPSQLPVGSLVVGGVGALASGVTGNELLLLPRYHLDLTSLLARHPLQQPPIAMDCLGSHILLASEPLEITLLEVSLHGELSPTGNPRATITMLREISMFDVGRYLSDVALVPLSPGAVGAAAAAAAAAAASGSTVTALAAAAPRQCVLLRWGGMISVLDLEKGSELALATEIEAFWLSDAITCQTGPCAGGMGGAAWTPNVGWSAGLPLGADSVAAMGLVSGPTSTSSSFSAKGNHVVVTGHGDVPVMPDALAADAGLAGQIRRPAEGPGSSPSTSLAATLDVEMPWWLYGPAGMQLCFPSSLGTPAALSMAYKEGHDIELEFDQEVYPVGISLADDAIVGITQRIVRGTGGPMVGPNGVAMASAAQLPCFHPIPESQPVLPCLLRRLLQRGAFQEAVSLARRHARGPHFARSLEWLLFTALEIDTSTSSLARPTASTAKRAGGTIAAPDALEGSTLAHQTSLKQHQQPQPPQQQSLLAAAADLVRHFPNLFAEVVVSVARKTDAALWPPLFDAVGSPSKLLDGLVEAGELASAACFLLIIDRLEGAPAAQEQALRLMRSSLQRGQYPLCCELLRFVVPPADQDTDSGRLVSPDRPLPTADVSAAPSAGGLPGGLQEQQQQQPAVASEQPSQKPSILQPGESSQQSGGGGGRTWLGWLLGYSADPEPSTSEPENGAERQQLQQESAQHFAVAPDPEGAPFSAPASAPPASHTAGAARAQEGLQAAGGRVPLAPNSPAQAGSLVAPSSPALAQILLGAGLSGDAASAANAKAACGLVAEHAWRLLEAGHLAALGQLLQTSSFLPGGLTGLMTQHRDSPYAARGCAVCVAHELLKCLTRAVSELPVWSSEAVEMCAVDVERLCREVGAVAWAVAMAVVLVDAATVTAFKQEQPVVWAEFVQLLHADNSLSYLWDIVEVLTDGVENAAKAVEQGRAGQAPEASTGITGITERDQRQGGGTGGTSDSGVASAAAASAYASGIFAASAGHVEVRPLSIGRPNSEIEEISQQGTPTAVIPGPHAAEVSISRP